MSLRSPRLLPAALAAIALPVTLCGFADPFAPPAHVRVLLFLRTDCPLTGRYAPEVRRIAQEFSNREVSFWLIYPDRSDSKQAIEAYSKQFSLPGTTIGDPAGDLVRRAHATVAPEAAVFDGGGHLLYHGRIDNRWVDFGKVRPTPTVHDLEDAISDALAGKPVAEAKTRAIGCSLADVQ